MVGLKENLKNNELTLGSWITLSHPSIAEIMANAGFDWLTVDMEHSAITLHQVQQLVQVIELTGCAPLVRVGCKDPNLIKRIMDVGANGVIVPMINSKEDAERAVRAVKYPPAGDRGVGLARAQSYGMDFEGYCKWVNEESVVIAQIEHIDAVKNLEDILSTDGIDGYIIGPYDLSGSMGIPGEFEHPKMKKALEQVEENSRGTKKPPGIHVIPPNPDEVREKISRGYKFIGYSLDTLILGISCRDGLKKIRK